jgi:hypothetical protein
LPDNFRTHPDIRYARGLMGCRTLIRVNTV